MQTDDTIKNRVNELADRYAGSMRRSAGENDMRKELREKIEEMGYSAKAFQPAVAIARTMTKGEADDYLMSLQFFVEALLGRQGELFPEAVEKINKRLEKQAAEGRSDDELDDATDSNPRSNPDAGGAPPQVQNPEGEQEEGAAALDAGLAQTKAKARAPRKAQSEIAAEKLAKAGLH